MTKTFILTMWDVNAEEPAEETGQMKTFILTMWDVNKWSRNSSTYRISTTFILTMWDVNISS